MALYPVAGSKIYIGRRVEPRNTDLTAADFSGATWLEISGWTQAGTVGDTQELITQKVISSKRVRKAKGTLDAGNMENTFLPEATDPGQIRFKEAIKSCKPYEFKIEWSADCLTQANVTIGASDGVITLNNHGFVAGAPVSFSSTGALPTGLTAGTTYYVVSTGLTQNAFRVAATPGGSAITTTAAGTGTHTVSAQPVGQTDMFYGLAMPGGKSGGDADTAQLRTWSIAIDSNIVEV